MEEFYRFDPDTAGTKGLVFIGDRLLVYRRDGNTKVEPHKIDIPGGGPEGDETPFETFQREVMEEFNLRIANDDVVYVRKYASKINPGKSAYFPVAKLGPEYADKISFGDEGEQYLLLSLEDYLERTDAWELFQERTRDYLESQRK